MPGGSGDAFMLEVMMQTAGLNDSAEFTGEQADDSICGRR